MTLLSRLLHRTPAAPEPIDICRQTVRDIRALIKPLEVPNEAKVEAFVRILAGIETQPNAAQLKQDVLHQLAFGNTNTSYIEPFVNAAFAQGHPQKTALGQMYKDFVVANNDAWLVSKMLDNRFYSADQFPVYAMGLLGQAGVQIPDHSKFQWIRRALLSETPITQIKASADAMKFDLNAVRDREHGTILHELMSSSDRSSPNLEHMLSRAQQLGIQRTPDLYGRYPEEFGRATDVLIFAKHYDVNSMNPLNALRDYLSRTVHNFGGLQEVHPKNTSIYLKENGLLSAVEQKTTLFEHVLASNNKTIISELNSLVAPKIQHNDIDATLPYVFLANYVCAPNGQSDEALVNDLFAMFQREQPRELSTAMGALLRSDAYCENNNVNIHELTRYRAAVENVLGYQEQKGLTDLLALEKDRLQTLVPVVQNDLSM